MKIFKIRRLKKYKEPNNQGNKNKKINENEINRLKEQYFSFYDDIKDYTKGKEDW